MITKTQPPLSPELGLLLLLLAGNGQAYLDAKLICTSQGFPLGPLPAVTIFPGSAGLHKKLVFSMYGELLPEFLQIPPGV